MPSQQRGDDGRTPRSAAPKVLIEGLNDPFCEDAAQMLVQDRPTAVSQPHLGAALMLVDVREEREAEREHPIGYVGRGSPAHRQSPKEERAHGAREQIVLVTKMDVERRSTDPGALEDIRDGDPVIRLLAHE